MKTPNLFLALCLTGALALSANSALAQTAPTVGFEQSDRYRTDPIKCLGITDLTMIEKECIQDEKLNENDRQQTRAIDRWMRGGMLTVATIMNQVRRIGGVVQTTQSLVEQIRRGSEGFKEKKASISAYRVVGASDAIDDVTNSLLMAGNALQENPGNRYFVVEASMQRSLQDAADGDMAAANLSESLLAIQYRLAKSTDSTGRGAASISSVRSIGGNWRDTLPGDYTCPPLPADAPASMVDGCLRPIGGESGYTGAESELGSTGPMMAIQRGGNTTTDKTNCPASGSDDLRFDPKVVYERILGQVRGAQAAAQGAIVNTGMAEAEANIVRQTETFYAKLKSLFVQQQSLRNW